MGGAGFIGAHVANELLAHGYSVRVLDAGSASARVGPEEKILALASVYALSRYDQEIMTLIVAAAYGMRAVACGFSILRAYQARSNPYTGVLCNFAARGLNGEPPLIYEDGNQSAIS